MQAEIKPVSLLQIDIVTGLIFTLPQTSLPDNFGPATVNINASALHLSVHIPTFSGRQKDVRCDIVSGELSSSVISTSLREINVPAQNP
jgi:hypothetical protein